jgi:glucosamine--fructose-6-phosphate aminotransferase (isomerizing)
MTRLATHMETEIHETPDVVRRQASLLAAPVAELLRRLKRAPPRVIVTCARGSSAHAATFGKHLFELNFGIPVAAAAPNIATVYKKDLRLDDQLFLAISQSGRSDDLIEQAHAAKRSGALTVALVNAPDSPLAAASDIVLPMAAGEEKSVAATKSFIASLSALMRLVAAWRDDVALTEALERLPDRLASAASLDWDAELKILAQATSLVAIGRGPTLAIAREAALKLKETCNLHAEAFSGAEILHGPVALVSRDYPLILFTPSDEAAPGMRALAGDLTAKGAALVPFETGSGKWSVLNKDRAETDVACLIAGFYALVVRLAELRGMDADRPRHLKKVTRTR